MLAAYHFICRREEAAAKRRKLLLYSQEIGLAKFWRLFWNTQCREHLVMIKISVASFHHRSGPSKNISIMRWPSTPLNLLRCDEGEDDEIFLGRSHHESEKITHQLSSNYTIATPWHQYLCSDSLLVAVGGIDIINYINFMAGVAWNAMSSSEIINAC